MRWSAAPEGVGTVPRLSTVRMTTTAPGVGRGGCGKLLIALAALCIGSARAQWRTTTPTIVAEFLVKTPTIEGWWSMVVWKDKLVHPNTQVTDVRCGLDIADHACARRTHLASSSTSRFIDLTRTPTADRDETPLVELRSEVQRPSATQRPEHPPAVHNADVVWAHGWIDNVLEAVVVKTFSRLEKLAIAAFKRTVVARLLVMTGIGFLIADRQLWCLASPLAQETALKTELKWRDESRKAEILMAKAAPRRPLGAGYVTFAHAAAMILESAEKELGIASDSSLEIASRLCAVQGFTSLQALDGSSVEELKLFVSKPATIAALRRLLQAAQDFGERQAANKKRRRLLGMPQVAAPGTSSSADTFAANLNTEEIARFEAHACSALQAAGLKDSDELAPRARVAAYAAAKAQGANVAQVLALKVEELRMEPLRRNIKSIASALRMWHFFAMTILGYEAARTLPPTMAAHVVMFLVMFRNGNTAVNYVNHLLAGCKALGYETAWHSEEVAAAKASVKMKTLRTHAVTKTEKQVLTTVIVRRLVALLDASGGKDFATAIIVWWQFLLRVQSEGLELCFGESSWEHHWPSTCAGAVWVKGTVACIRLRVRKHRPAGSLLQRPCSCKSSLDPLCVAHRLLSEDRVLGSAVLEISAYEALKKIRSALVQLQVDKPSGFTLKAFRAGKATAMAAEGDGLAAILQAGEWRSAAFLHYLCETEVDRMRLLQHAIDDDAEEE